MIRKPAAAGAFYPGTQGEIEKMVVSFVEEDQKKEKAIGIISPHAGYMYSGKGAGIIFSRVVIPDDVIILGPNHRGYGADMAIVSEGEWEMPTGNVKMNSDLAGKIKSRSELFQDDDRAHSAEHSIEVQIPFIQHFRPDFRLVPISLSRVSFDECKQLGEALANAVKDYGRDVLIVASSDMTHFESAGSAKKKDELALKEIESLNPEGLYDVVLKNRISMCGFISVTIMLVAALGLGAKTAECIDYRNSGDVTGDNSDVVAYASVLVK
jgi:AmmeMemoRadiSam system protein B